MTRSNLAADINNPDSDMVRAALTRRCIVCKATPSTTPNCTDIYGASPLKGRLVHFARTAA